MGWRVQLGEDGLPARMAWAPHPKPKVHVERESEDGRFVRVREPGKPARWVRREDVPG